MLNGRKICTVRVELDKSLLIQQHHVLAIPLCALSLAISFSSFPAFNKRYEQHDGSKNQSPFPGQRQVSEDDAVDHGNVDDGKGRDETSHHRPEEKAVLGDGREEGQALAGVFIRVHVEQREVEVLGLPSHDG